MIREVLLYFFTIRHLKLSQIIYKLLYYFYTPNVPEINKNIYSRKTRISKFHWLKKSSCFPILKIYEFLNSRYKIEKFSDLDKFKIPKLWLYNFHYFDYLYTDNGINNFKESESLILSWISIDKKTNKIGWEPYPISLRIVNWIKWSILSNNNNISIKNSLYIQAVILSKQIEWHIRANHLIANAKALIFCGVYLRSKFIKNIKRKGETILYYQLDEQILNDGGHFERSTMYHSIILEDLLDILELDRVYPNFICPRLIDRIKIKLPKMMLWLNRMLHPDGEISFFHDSTKNIASSPSSLIKLFQRFFPKFNLTYKPKTHYFENLKNSGYIITENKIYKCLMDVGSIAPQYQPGHSHAQTLCFELSLFKHRVFVNTGVSQYEENERRFLERSTLAHNTLTYNNENSSEVWSSFRVARKAKTFDVSIKKSEKYININACHDGYSRFNKNLIHNRQWVFNDDNIIITDKLLKNYNFHCNLILEPNVKLTKKHEKYSIYLENNKEINLSFNECETKLFDWNYAPGFGLLVKTKCIKIFPKTEKLITYISW